jgi:pyruvate dehydrogenase E2 component (dihydrolipoamide acetyltransferase)
VLAAPAARQLAREHGIDLSRVQGSGPGGRIEKEDVQRAIASWSKL